MIATKLKILLANSNPADARQVSDRLEQHCGECFQLEFSPDLNGALKRLPTEDFDLLLLDVSACDSKGLDLVGEARNQAPEIPLVVLVADSGNPHPAEYIRAGAQDVVAWSDGDASTVVRALELAGERLKKELYVRQAQKQLERTGRVLGFGKWEISLDEGIVTASEAASLIYGLEGREWPLALVQSIPLPKYRPILDKALKELIAGASPYNVEFKIKRPIDGRVADIQSVAEYDIKSRKVFGVIKDITGNKKAEEALRESEHRYRLLAEHSNDVIWTMSLDGKFTYVSPSVFQLRGYTPDEVLRQPMEEVVCPGSLPSVMEGLSLAMKEAVTGEKQVTATYYQIEQPRKDGKTVWTEVSASLVYDNGRPSHILGVSRDITARRRTEEALKEREAKLAAVFRAAPIGIAVSVNREIKEVNETMCRMAGYSCEELIGQSTRLLYDNDADFERLGAKLYEALSLRGQVTMEISARHKDGSHFPLLLSAAALDPSDISKGIVFTSLDITERDKAQAAVKEREAKLDAVLRAAPVGIAVVVNRVFREVNDTLCRMSGYSREEIIGQTTRFLYYSDADFERVGVELAQALAARGQATVEMAGRRKDGSRMPMLLSGSPLDVTDPSKGVIFTVLDITERKRAEEALRQSEEKYRLLFASGNDAVFFLDEDNCFVEVNDRACQVLGYSREELLRMGIKDIDDPSIKLDWTAIQDQMQTSGFAVFEQVHLTKDRRRIPVELSARPMHIDGRTMFLSVARDITERKRAEVDMQRSLSLLSATLESTADGILVVDLAGKVQRYSSRFAKMWGVPKSILKTSDDGKLLDFVLDQVSEPERFSQRVKEIYAQPELSTSDIVLFKDGRIFERYSRPQRLEGEVVGRVWSFRDVTDRKKMELRLVRSAEEWRATFDAISTPVSIQDRDFKILRVNKAFAAAMNTAPEAIIGKTCFEVSHGTHEPVEKCPHVQTLKNGVAAEVEIHDTKTGSYTVVSTYPMFGSSGEVVASVHISQDVTERKKMQERLMVTDRLASVGELAAGIAHEINNPLTGVLGFSELVLSADIPQNVRRDIEVIHSEAQRAAEVVKNLLIFARRHQQMRQDLSVNDIIGKVLALRSYEQKINNIEVVTELDPNLPEISADYFQLQQVFLNIILNAEFFMSKAHCRGKLLVTTTQRQEDRLIRIAFTDDGPGIVPDVLDRLFDPFFTTKDVGQGTGLGLSISHGIVEQHGGKIWAESEPGNGATFIIELPVSPPPPIIEPGIIS